MSRTVRADPAVSSLAAESDHSHSYVRGQPVPSIRAATSSLVQTLLMPG